MPIGILEPNKAPPMEFAAAAGLVLFISSEIIPYTPLKGNGVVEAIMNALMQVFPKPDAE